MTIAGSITVTGATQALPLLLVPGLLCDEDSWSGLADALAPHRPVIVGPCAMPEPLDRLVDMARHLLRAVPAPRFAVAGHSMGGRIALEMLRLAPERIAGLALLDSGTAARPAGAAGEEERVARLSLVELARREGLDAVARQWLPPMVHAPVLGTALHERMVAMVVRTSVDRFAAQVQALLDRPDAEPVLRSARCPVLLVCGQQDRWSPPDRHRAMQSLVPSAVLRLIDECGHMSPMEQPAAVTAALTSWLAQCDATG